MWEPVPPSPLCTHRSLFRDRDGGLGSPTVTSGVRGQTSPTILGEGPQGKWGGPNPPSRTSVQDLVLVGTLCVVRVGVRDDLNPDGIYTQMGKDRTPSSAPPEERWRSRDSEVRQRGTYGVHPPRLEVWS